MQGCSAKIQARMPEISMAVGAPIPVDTEHVRAFLRQMTSVSYLSGYLRVIADMGGQYIIRERRRGCYWTLEVWISKVFILQAVVYSYINLEEQILPPPCDPRSESSHLGIAWKSP